MRLLHAYALWQAVCFRLYQLQSTPSGAGKSDNRSALHTYISSCPSLFTSATVVIFAPLKHDQKANRFYRIHHPFNYAILLFALRLVCYENFYWVAPLSSL